MVPFILCFLSGIIASSYIDEFQSSEKSDHKVSFKILEDSDPYLVAENGCRNEYTSCMFLAVSAVQRYKALKYNHTLTNWTYNNQCKCAMPTQEKLPVLQFLHIPKTGTSINWFLHDYFDCPTGSDNPCSSFLSKPEDQSKGLCGGRLFSCAGHRVAPELAELTLTTNTNLLTLLRHPWSRIQSNYYYLRSNPLSSLLSPEINGTDLLLNVQSPFDFAVYPGVSNCATKMLNGIQCAANVPIDQKHLDVAKAVLSAMLFFGITEKFKTSVCLLSWMYGGDVKERHFKSSRMGSYTRRPMEDALSDWQLAVFRDSEKYDLALYEFAEQLFNDRLALTGCPLLDKPS